MVLEVVGAGFGRTGTLSLKQALETLGVGRCYHMLEIVEHPEHRVAWSAAARGEAVDWEALFAGYRAAVDWPAARFWRELAAYYPDAKVLLSVRDSERWYESVRNTIYAGSQADLASADPATRERGAWTTELIWDGVFDGGVEDRDHAIAVYEAHIATVRAAIPADRLLVFDASQGWEPLCAFLDRPVPDEPYPRTNSTEQFRARRDARTRSN